jgi:effector-binding domain-containing protein
MPKTIVRLALAGLLAVLVALPLPDVRADESAPSAPAPPPPAAQSAPPTPAPSGSPPAVQAPTPPAAPQSSPPGETANPQGEGSTGETVDLPARPFVYIEGKADRDEIFSAILGSLGLVKRDLDKAGLKASGPPFAVFVGSDDNGFRYHAGFPLGAAPDGKASLSDAVKIGETPSGKAMRFQHLGAYADIDATYDAITAYLDEKGIEAQDTFIEEYPNEVKDPDDPTLEVNIYVLLK